MKQLTKYFTVLRNIKFHEKKLGKHGNLCDVSVHKQIKNNHGGWPEKYLSGDNFLVYKMTVLPYVHEHLPLMRKIVIDEDDLLPGASGVK